MGHTILVIEDDTDIRNMLANAFQLENEDMGTDYTLIEATNGQEGLNKLDMCKPDLILLDLMMPVLDGKEFLTILHERCDTTPVVVITASASEREKAWQEYCVEYAILKPFNLDDLFNAVDSLIKQTVTGELAAVLAR